MSKLLYVLVGVVLTSLLVGIDEARSGNDSSHSRITIQEYVDEGGDQHKYGLFLPIGYESSTHDWPIVVFLHGASERGDEGKLPTTIGLGPFLETNPDRYPFIALFPQADVSVGEIKTVWNAEGADAERALRILETVERTYRVDTNQRILTGWSMGGYGCWSLAAAHPDLWSAVVPLSSGRAGADLDQIASVPVWAIHGADDRLVDATETLEAVAALNSANGRAVASVVPDADHNVWLDAYGNSDLIAWMLEPKTDDAWKAVAADFESSRSQVPFDRYGTQPFRPALIVDSAARMELGDEFLDDVAGAVPQLVDQALLNSTLPNTSTTRKAILRQVKVTFCNMNYSVDLVGSSIEPQANGQLCVSLGLKNLKINIGSTSIRLGRASATAGTICIQAGRRAPLWMTLRLKPEVVGDRLKLKLVSRSFRIPANDFYVSKPAGVRARGLILTPQLVSTQLVDGLKESRTTIEQQVRDAAPRIVAELEEQIDFSKATSYSDAAWPFAYYQPRIRVAPQAISVDQNGILLDLRATVGAVNPYTFDGGLRQLSHSPSAFAKTSQTSQFRAGINVELFNEYTGMLAKDGLLHVAMNDIPEPLFHRFNERAVMEQYLPELKALPKQARVLTELEVDSPVKFAIAGDGSGGADRLNVGLTAGRLNVNVFTATSDEAFQKYATFEIKLDEQVQLQLLDRDQSSTEIGINWPDAVPGLTMTAHYESADLAGQPIETKGFQQAFEEAWLAWRSRVARSNTKIKHLEFGPLQLRAHKFYAQPPLAGLEFSNSKGGY